MGVLFDELRQSARDQGVADVLVRTKVGGTEQDGHFRLVPTGDGGVEPIILVRVQSGNDKVVNDVQDAIVLAHETGHFKRWKDGVENHEYRICVDSKTQLSPSSPLSLKEAVINEERRAWEYAREALKARGFNEWEVFENYSSVAFLSYFTQLALPPEPL